MDASSDLYNLIFWGVLGLSSALLLFLPRIRRRAPKKKRRVERVAFRPLPKVEPKEPERLPEAGVLRPDTLVFRSAAGCALFVSRAFEAEAAEGEPVEAGPEVLRRFSPLFSRSAVLEDAPEDEWSGSVYRVSFPSGRETGFSAGEDLLLEAFSGGVRLGGPMRVPAGGALLLEFFRFLEEHAPAHPLKRSFEQCRDALLEALERLEGGAEAWKERLEELGELEEKAASARDEAFERSVQLMAELRSVPREAPEEAEVRTLFRRALALLGIMATGDCLCGMRLASQIVEDVRSFPPNEDAAGDIALRHGAALSRLRAGLSGLQARADRAVLYADAPPRWAVRLNDGELPEALLFLRP